MARKEDIGWVHSDHLVAWLSWGSHGQATAVFRQTEWGPGVRREVTKMTHNSGFLKNILWTSHGPDLAPKSHHAGVLSAMAPKTLTLLVLLRFTSACGCCRNWLLLQGWDAVGGGWWSGPVHRIWRMTLSVWPWAVIEHLEDQGFHLPISTAPDTYMRLITTSSHIGRNWKVQPTTSIWNPMAWLSLNLVIMAWLILMASKSLTVSEPHPRREVIFSSSLNSN